MHPYRAISCMPPAVLPVASLIAPTTNGAANPDRLPSELITAKPTAAIAGPSSPGTSAQKIGNAAYTPNAATHSNASSTGGYGATVEPPSPIIASATGSN